ncbi:MAG: murein hydrolase activator EnvC family protein [Massiliimalia sp.]|jgi:murein DD-endopeptidase MepM/ murein hydrolase activator NlpD
MVSVGSHKMLHKLTAVFLAVLICVLTIPYSSVNVEAATSSTLTNLQNQLNSLEQQQKDIEARLNTLKQDKANAQQQLDEYTAAMENVHAQIDVYQQQIDAFNAEIDAKNQEITVKNQEISQKETEISDKQAELDQSYEDFKDRLAAMYMASCSSSSMNVLFGAESFSDFLTQAQALKNISDRDKEIMDDLMAQKQALEDLKVQLETAKTDLQNVVADIEKDKADIVSVQAKVQSQYDELAVLQNDCSKVVQSLQAQQNQLDADSAALDAEREKAIAAIIAEQERLRQEEEAAGNKPPINTGSGWLWPCPTYSYVSQYYSSGHRAIDVASGAGNPILATRGGTVVFAGFGSASNGFNRYGNVVLLSHGDGYYSLYAHCSSLNVSTGQTVSQGQQIATVGNTGQSFGNHLHFEIRTGVQGSRLDPMGFVSAPH